MVRLKNIKFFIYVNERLWKFRSRDLCVVLNFIHKLYECEPFFEIDTELL